MFDNILMAIRKNKVTLTLSKPAYIRTCISDLQKVLMYEFTDIDSLMYEIKTEDVYENFSKDKEMFDFSYYSTGSKCHNDSNKLVVRKTKGETDS